jgi:formyltetrahydrofolate synthetase
MPLADKIRTVAQTIYRAADVNFSRAATRDLERFEAEGAGARVIGLCAGGHIRPGHDAALRAAGAHEIAWSYAEVAKLAG